MRRKINEVNCDECDKTILIKEDEWFIGTAGKFCLNCADKLGFVRLAEDQKQTK
jgi:hypothetical protein